MDTKGYGALPSQVLSDMITGGFIANGSIDRVQPSSIDLALTDRAYRVHSIFQPLHGEPIEHAMHAVSPEKHDLRSPLEVGWTYLIKLQEELKLQDGVYAFANPKSTTGRIDLHVRMIADGMECFDWAGEPGYKGSLWVLVTPRSFRVKVHPGSKLLQLRAFNQDTRFRSNGELQVEHQNHGLMFLGEEPVPYSEIRRNNGMVKLTIDLERELVGWRCEGSREILDFSKEGAYEIEDFFQPVYKPKHGKGLTLRRGDFYLLASRERVRFPHHLAGEMVAIDPRSGDVRMQYAGYFDPGFGLGPNKDLKGTAAVLEVRSFEENITLRPGQAICGMVFERMAMPPDIVYGQAGNSYATQQGPRPSKHFKKVT